MSAKIQCVATKCGIFIISIVALNENGKLRLKLSFLVIIVHKRNTDWTSNLIVIVKRKYIFEGETSPLHEMSVFPNSIFQDDGGS